jgi:hypothetical protein
MQEAARSVIRLVPMGGMGEVVEKGPVDARELRRLERWLIRRSLAWFADPEVAETIRRLVAAGSVLGERYQRYQRETRTLAEAWAVPPVQPSEETP